MQVQPLCDSPLAAAVNTLGSSSMPENLRFSSPTRCREPLLSARSSTLCTVFSTAHKATASQHMTLIITTQLLIRPALGTVHTSHNDKVIQRSGSLSKIHSRFPCPFSASTRLIGQQEGHSAYKKSSSAVPFGKPLHQSPRWIAKAGLFTGHISMMMEWLTAVFGNSFKGKVTKLIKLTFATVLLQEKEHIQFASAHHYILFQLITIVHLEVQLAVGRHRAATHTVNFVITTLLADLFCKVSNR